MRTYEELSKFTYDHIYPEVERLDHEICPEMPWVVDAEWLHEKLQIKKPFKAWIRFLKKDGMQEGDYYTSWQTMAATLKPVKVYHITLENVLVICYNQKTEIGNTLFDFYSEYQKMLNLREIIWDALEKMEKASGKKLPAGPKLAEIFNKIYVSLSKKLEELK
ncbi:MAG: antA/AntB antirepressor family protein [Clostridium sp.]|nr:antA/AntB antirepressor family protein [Clostridium sp.]